VLAVPAEVVAAVEVCLPLLVLKAGLAVPVALAVMGT
jgi:hypothetical protein